MRKNNDNFLPFNPPARNPSAYILLTSLNLGGAEKIVSDSLWANYYLKSPTQYTLIVLHDKELEHDFPPHTHIIRLRSQIEKGEMLFRQIAFERKTLVCHLINDAQAQYLFSLGVHISLVIHNDKRSWSTEASTFNHPQTLSLVAVCEYVKNQLKEYTQKPIYTFRHLINFEKYQFSLEKRAQIRQELHLQDSDIVIGMCGRIAEQKNYFLAVDTLYELQKTNPSYKLVILGGFEKRFQQLYLKLLKKIIDYKLQKSVLLLGFRQNPQDYLSTFDIAFNTSYFEGLSMALQEFQGNGLPIIASNVCGQKEILDSEGQISFFDYPEVLCDPKTSEIQLNSLVEGSEFAQEHKENYRNLVRRVASLFLGLSPAQRVRKIWSKEFLDQRHQSCWASHNLWGLLNFIPYKQTQAPLAQKQSIPVRPAPLFLTANLNLGGAQKSLTNLLCHMAQNNAEDKTVPHLAIASKSNFLRFLERLQTSGVYHYGLSAGDANVYVLMRQLFENIQFERYETIVFWNVDVKMKVLLTKLAPFLELIEVSPGDYIFEELKETQLFLQGIYYDAEQFNSDLSHYVSKFYHKGKSRFVYASLDHKTTVIPNGVEIFKAPPLAPIPKERKVPYQFLVCGRLSPSKHIREICIAFTQFLTTLSPAETRPHLTFVGKSEDYFSDYENGIRVEFKNWEISNDIEFLPSVPEPFEIFSRYDTLIVLGTHQGSPNMVLEAASYGLPVIANASGGTAEVIDNSRGILLPENFTSEEVEEAISWAYRHPDDMRARAALAQTHTHKTFSMTAMSEAYARIIYKENPEASKPQG